MMKALHQLGQQLSQAKRESDTWVQAGRQIMHWPQPLGWKTGLGRLHERLTVPNKIGTTPINAGEL